MDIVSRRSKRSFVIGCVLGDGHLNKYGGLQIVHGLRQKEYVEYKRSVLKNLQHKTIKINEYIIKNSYGEFPAVRFETQVRPIYKRLRKILYPGGSKKVTRKALDYLDECGLSVWFMDDGSSSIKRKGYAPSLEVTLNTYVSKEENEIIIKYFEETWNIRWGLNKSKGKFRLRMGTKEFRKFTKIIEPYVIPCMRYKINKLYNLKREALNES